MATELSTFDIVMVAIYFLAIIGVGIFVSIYMYKLFLLGGY